MKTAEHARAAAEICTRNRLYTATAEDSRNITIYKYQKRKKILFCGPV